MKKLLSILVLLLLSLVSCSTPDPIEVATPKKTVEISRGVLFQYRVNGGQMQSGSVTNVTGNSVTYSVTLKLKVGDVIWFGGGIPDKTSKATMGMFIVKQDGVEVMKELDDNGQDGYPIGLEYIVI